MGASPNPIRVAIIGAGNIAVAHLAAYLSLGNRYQIAAVCDIDEKRARELAQQAAGCKTVPEAEALLGDPTIEVIDICAPPMLHGPMALAALAAGKHVVCEKPMACSVAQAKEMAAAAKVCDRILMPVFQYRYGKAFRQLEALRQAGLTGKAYVASLETHWNRGADYYSSAPWRGTWKVEQGGAVLSHAIHSHDLISCCFGPFTSVTAMLDTRVNKIETEDCAAICFSTESGGLVSSSVTLGAANDTSRLRLVYEKLTAESGSNPYAPGESDWNFIARDPCMQGEIDQVASKAAEEPLGFAGQFKSFADHLAGKKGSPIITPAEGVASIETAAAIYFSARERRRIPLPLDEKYSSWQPEIGTAEITGFK